MKYDGFRYDVDSTDVQIEDLGGSNIAPTPNRLSFGPINRGP